MLLCSIYRPGGDDPIIPIMPKFFQLRISKVWYWAGKSSSPVTVWQDILRWT